MAIPVPRALPELRRPSRQRRHGSTFWPTDRVFDDLRMLQVVALDCLPKAETVSRPRASQHASRAHPSERSLPDEESSRLSAHRADLARSRLVRPLRPAGHPFFN